jgi:hypothetical protein
VFDDETGEPVMRPKTPPPYEAVAERCPGGAAIGRLQEVAQNEAKQSGQDLRGMRFFLRPMVVEISDDEPI